MKFNNPASTRKTNMTTLRFIKSIGRSPSRLALLLIPLVLACFALSPRAQAVVPPPDGDYPGFNTAEGENALLSLTSGTYNTAIGFLSLQDVTTGARNTGVGAATLVFNNGVNNTAIGAGALLNNTTGSGNTATGFFALIRNTEGGSNTANGASALAFNTTGDENTATGANALSNNTASRNTANGANALLANTTGFDNTATGANALSNNTESRNTANGSNALFANTTGFANTAMGNHALATNISGTANTAIGNDVLHDSTGDNNTAVGNRALGTDTTGEGNTAVGAFALLNNNTGNFNTALGDFAGRNLTGSNNIDVGFGVEGMAGESNTIRIGYRGISDTFISGISGATAAGGAAVFVTSNGHLGTTTSSARFKDEIKPMGNASEAILALRPVSFRYKKEIDPQAIPQFGLVAEEVEKVNPDLVIREADGRPQTVRYEQVNAMLLNEFLKEHCKVQEQEATIAQLKKDFQATVAQLTTRLDEQAAQIQKVSVQLAAAIPSRGGLETTKFATGRIRRGGPAPQVVNNP